MDALNEHYDIIEFSFGIGKVTCFRSLLLYD